jgi:hypothetical protein
VYIINLTDSLDPFAQVTPPLTVCQAINGMINNAYIASKNLLNEKINAFDSSKYDSQVVGFNAGPIVPGEPDIERVAT